MFPDSEMHNHWTDSGVGRVSKNDFLDTTAMDFAQCVNEAPNMEDHSSSSVSRNVYVRNLSPSIRDNELRDMFAPFGPITSAKVLLHVRSGLSRQFGFVLFESEDSAIVAVDEMNGKMLPPTGEEESHGPLIVTFASHRVDDIVLDSPRVQIWNIPPTVSPQELRDNLLQKYGTVVALGRRDFRGVKKSRCRGWAAVAEFSTVEEAKVAQKELHDTKTLPLQKAPLNVRLTTDPVPVDTAPPMPSMTIGGYAQQQGAAYPMGFPPALAAQGAHMNYATAPIPLQQATGPYGTALPPQYHQISVAGHQQQRGPPQLRAPLPAYPLHPSAPVLQQPHLTVVPGITQFAPMNMVPTGSGQQIGQSLPAAQQQQGITVLRVVQLPEGGSTLQQVQGHNL